MLLFTLVIVIVILFAGDAPPRLEPDTVIVSNLAYPVPALAKLTKYLLPFLVTSTVAPVPVPLVVVATPVY